MNAGGRRSAATTWRSWSGLAGSRPSRVVEPGSAAAVRDEVLHARERAGTVKMVGTGHSFNDVAMTDGTLLTPGGLRGVRSVDRQAMTVTVGAGTRLDDLSVVLERLGLALHNLGDIAEQTVAGAIATGTHGAGGRVSGLAGLVTGLELVTGTGELLVATAEENPDVLALGRVGLGALGVVTAVTLRVEPLFWLEADERPMDWTEVLGRFDELDAEADHLDLYWFPHTDRMLTTRTRRLAEGATPRPLPRWRAWRDDELVANTVLGVVQAGVHRVPRLKPAVGGLAAHLSSPRRYSDVGWRVLTASRRVRFHEMEYAVPREAGVATLREARRLLDGSGLRIGFPVEIRTGPADDVPLSLAHGRDTVYLAFQTWHREEHRAWFALLEPLLREVGGRPHWGKVHTDDAEQLTRVHPHLDDFRRLRDRLDPDRVLANDYLRRVLGD